MRGYNPAPADTASPVPRTDSSQDDSFSVVTRSSFDDRQHAACKKCHRCVAYRGLCLLPAVEEETGRRWMGRDAAPRPDDTLKRLF